MPGRSIRIGTFYGIPFGIHPLWVPIVVLISWTLAVGYYPEQVDGIAAGPAWLLGLASALLLFASIVAHEYGHAIVARSRGVEVEEIDLWLLGGVARMRGSAHRPEDELAYALAGPAVTLVAALLFGAAALAVPSDAAPALHALLAYQALVNGAILVFNMLPGFPLDGGRVLHALLWRRNGDMLRSTAIAAGVGRAFGVLLIALGVLGALSGAVGGLWFALIGYFIVSAGAAETTHAEVLELFEGVPAGDLMTSPAVCIPADASVDRAITIVLGHPHPAFPVVEDERAVGLVSVEALERVPAGRRADVRVAELADRDPGLLVAPDTDVTELIELPAFGRMLRAAVVDGDGRPLGVLSVTDVQRALDAHRRLAGPAAGAGSRPATP
jgi:Zn-dependent protease/predicted transcriptional regulator